MTKLLLVRDESNDTCTLGKLYIDGVFECHTLEDVDRRLEDGGKKIIGQTAIPRGLYKVVIAWSPRFDRALPRLLNVPQFEGILIHSGNCAADTHGCILVGLGRSGNTLNHSRRAFDILFAKLDHERDISIEVK